jgi:GR25 family glycosyltransferase involved in LPS biosynthesis
VKVYLINLERDADRLAHMRAQLNGIGFERISAVDGSKDPPTTRGLSRFELACLESHKLAWRAFLGGPAEHACFLEDDLHIRPGLAALVGDPAWIPDDALCVKLDTYLQKVRLGGREPAIGGRQVARLYTRHQSSAAYMLTRAGAIRYLELTANASLPADYALFPKNPRRAGLTIYQLVPAIAVQDHLVAAKDGGQRFATAMAGADGSARLKKRSPVLKRLAREGVRIFAQFPDFTELAYQKAFLRVETTIVDAG